MKTERETVVEVHDLQVSFDGQKILRGVNLTIPKGEVVVAPG